MREVFCRSKFASDFYHVVVKLDFNKGEGIAIAVDKRGRQSIPGSLPQATHEPRLTLTVQIWTEVPLTESQDRAKRCRRVRYLEPSLEGVRQEFRNTGQRVGNATIVLKIRERFGE